MSHEQTAESAAQEKTRRAAHIDTPPEHVAEETTEPAYPGTLLGTPRLTGRGNGPVQAALMQSMQQTRGNRYTQRAIQRAAATSPPAAGEDIADRIQAKAGGGSSLDTSVQTKLESGLGADLSAVRVHTDDESDRLASSVDAVAFTTGSDIFFRSGAYNPGSSDGLRLLAHEATHTVQQAAGPVAGTPVGGGVAVSDPSDSFEQAAERSADHVMAGGRAAAASSGAGAPAVQRAAAPPEEELVPAQAMSAGTRTGSLQRDAAPEAGLEEDKKKPEEESAPVQAMRASTPAGPLQRSVTPVQLSSGLRQLTGGIAGMRPPAPRTALRGGRGPILQRRVHPFNPANASYSQPELDPGPVIEHCRAAAGNVTGVFSDDPLWPKVQGLAGRLRRAFSGDYFQHNGTFSDSEIYDPGVMYPNYKVTVNVTMYEDDTQSVGPGATATVGTSTGTSTGSQSSNSTTNTATGGVSAEAGEKDKAKAGATAGGSTSSTTGSQSSQTVTGATTGSQQSQTTVMTSNLIAEVEVIVDQYDRMSSYHTWGGAAVRIPVGSVRYTNPTQMAAPPPR